MQTEGIVNFKLQQWLCERAAVLHYTDIACFVILRSRICTRINIGFCYVFVLSTQRSREIPSRWVGYTRYIEHVAVNETSCWRHWVT
jgi:hypothetical protein